MRILALLEPAEVTYQAGKDGWWCRRGQDDNYIIVGRSSGIITLFFHGYETGMMVSGVCQRGDGVALIQQRTIGDGDNLDPVETANAVLTDLVHPYAW